MNADEARSVAIRLVEFLETGKAPDDLFTEDVFLDFTLPRWRLQAQGRDPVVGMRRQGHPCDGKVPRWRCDPTPAGFVPEVEARWQQDGREWYCRELFRVDVRGPSISELSVYGNGDWDADREAEHRQGVKLIRP